MQANQRRCKDDAARVDFCELLGSDRVAGFVVAGVFLDWVARFVWRAYVDSGGDLGSCLRLVGIVPPQPT